MSTFSEVWFSEVRPLAEACIPDHELIRILCRQGSNHPLNSSEIAYLKNTRGKYKDVEGMYFISDMIWRVEHSLASSREKMAKLCAMNVYSLLVAPDYCKKVFNGDEENQEWKSRKNLLCGLKKLLDI